MVCLQSMSHAREKGPKEPDRPLSKKIPLRDLFLRDQLTAGSPGLGPVLGLLFFLDGFGNQRLEGSFCTILHRSLASSGPSRYRQIWDSRDCLVCAPNQAHLS